MPAIRRIVAMVFCAVLVFGALSACSNGSARPSSSSASSSWPGTIDFPVDYGQSELFSHDDIDKAVETVMSEFGTWKGATMKSVSFTDDETCKNDIAYLNDLRQGNGARFDAAIVLKSDFHSPNAEDAAGTAWKPDTDYNDYEWHLGRTGNGDWQLVTWGY